MLSKSTGNIRLPSEAEIAAQQAAEQEKLAVIRDVEVKIRLPDQSAISARFGQGDSGADLYRFVRECLDEQWRGEGFVLRNPGIRGKGEVVQDDERKRLIKDLGLKGRVLVVFGWDDENASVDARGTKEILREEMRNQAKEIKVEDVLAQGDDKDEGVKINIGKASAIAEDDKGKKKGMPKWLNKLSKK